MSEKVIDTNPGILSGTGIEEDPFLIESIEDLVALGQAVDSGEESYEGLYVKLTTNLNFNDDNSYVNKNRTDFGDINGNGNATEGLRSELTTGAGFNPIGSGSIPFLGNFDGNNKYIKNLYIDRAGSVAGLFAIVAYGKINDLGIINADVSSNEDFVGILAGEAIEVEIYNCYAIGEINNSNSTVQAVGGLVGMVASDNGIAMITNSYATGNVSGYQGVGGLIGDVAAENMTISNSYASGNVSGYQGVGGLAGMAHGDVTAGQSTIQNCYSTGNVTGLPFGSGNTMYIGPFVGYKYGAVLTGFYRYNNLTCTSCDNTLGTAVTAANLGSSDWHRNTLGWNSQWSLTNEKYPLLYEKDTTTLLGGQQLINTP